MGDTRTAPPRYLAYSDFLRVVRGRAASSDTEFALVSLDFDNFNFVNDLFSYQVGDEALRRITTHLAGGLEDGEWISRIHADRYVAWVRMVDTHPLEIRLASLAEVRTVLADILPTHYNLVCSGGIVPVPRGERQISTLLDKADFARKKAKGNSVNTFLRYTPEMAQEIRWRKVITLTMEGAMKNREFEMYLQPKVLIKTGQLAGAEALARWNSRQHGLILPNHFIPIMEQNGYIRQIDFFILEEACQFLRQAIIQKLPVLPISVNFSKIHVRDAQFVERICQTVTRYNLPNHLIEVEFTESAFAGNLQPLVEIAGELRRLGFRVALDDFGSAYSSLNCLKELPVDVVKIDKGFLQSSANTEKGRVILARMVELIKSLRMVSVIEGVETEEQVGFLRRLSGDLGQGYHYGMPQPAEVYRTLLCTKETLSGWHPDDRHSTLYSSIPQEFQMDSWDLYTLGQNIDMGLMKGYLDGEATVQYINDRALEYLGYTRQEFREVFCNSIMAFTHPDDAGIVAENAKQLVESGTPLKFQTRALRKDGKTIVLQGRASCVSDEHGRPVGIYAFQDVTEELERTRALQQSLEDKITLLEQSVAAERASREALRISEERYRLVVEQSDDILFEWDFTTDSVSFSDKYQEKFGRPPNQTSVSHNPEIRARVYPTDLPQFERWVEETFAQPNCTRVEFRFQHASGNYLWMQVRTTPILNGNGVPLRTVGVFSDIDRQKRELDSLTLKSQVDPLTKLLNKGEVRRRVEDWLTEHPDQPGAFFIIDVDNFKQVNDSLGHQLGDAVLVEVAQKIRRLFRERDVVGRVGGDEMMVFASGLSGDQELQQRTEAVLEAIRGTYFRGTTRCPISGSVGVACCPQHGQRFDELYRLADVALYDAKARGKNCYTIYPPAYSAI